MGAMAAEAQLQPRVNPASPAFGRLHQPSFRNSVAANFFKKETQGKRAPSRGKAPGGVEEATNPFDAFLDFITNPRLESSNDVKALTGRGNQDPDEPAPRGYQQAPKLAQTSSDFMSTLVAACFGLLSGSGVVLAMFRFRRDASASVQM